MKQYSFAYEIPIFYIIMAYANKMVLPEVPGFYGIDPHPFWLGILIFGFRYGVLAGFLSGVMSAIMYLTVRSWITR